MLAYISTCNPILTSVPQTGLASILEILRVVLSFYERNMELFNYDTLFEWIRRNFVTVSLSFFHAKSLLEINMLSIHCLCSYLIK